MKNFMFIGALLALFAICGCFAEEIDKNPNTTEITGLPCMGKEYGTLLPHPKNESKYLICITSTSLWIAPCPDKLVFNQHIGICAWENKPPENFTAHNSTVKDRPVLFKANASESQLLSTRQNQVANSTILFAVLSTTQVNEVVRKEETVSVPRVDEQVAVTKIPAVQLFAEQMPIERVVEVAHVTVPTLPVTTVSVPVVSVAPVAVSTVPTQPVTVKPVVVVSPTTIQPVVLPVVELPKVPVQPVVSVQPVEQVVRVPHSRIQTVDQIPTVTQVPPMVQAVQPVISPVLSATVKPTEPLPAINNPFSSNFVFFKNNRILDSLLKARV